MKKKVNKKNRHKRNFTLLKIFAIIFSLIILGLFFYSFINYEVLKKQVNEQLQEQIENYGYVGIFVVAFILEITPQPFASFIVPFTTGLILGLNFALLLPVTLLSVICAGFFAYGLGIRYGEWLALKVIRKKTYKIYFKIFEKYGRIGMTLIALTPIPYFPIIAGVFKMKLKDFVLFAVIPRIIHVVIFSYILYLLF